jgi:hypothetical protein
MDQFRHLHYDMSKYGDHMSKWAARILLCDVGDSPIVALGAFWPAPDRRLMRILKMSIKRVLRATITIDWAALNAVQYVIKEAFG